MSQSSLDSLLDGETNDISNHSYHASIHYESSGINSTLNNIGVRLRGNTSLNSPKKSFKLDFNAFIPGQKLFGLEKYLNELIKLVKFDKKNTWQTSVNYQINKLDTFT